MYRDSDFFLPYQYFGLIQGFVYEFADGLDQHDAVPPLALVTECLQVPDLWLRLCPIPMDRPLVSLDTSLFRGYRGSFVADGVGRGCSSTPPVSFLMLDAVIRALRFRRFEHVQTAIRIGSAGQAYRSKPLCVALSQVCYFFASAVGICAPESNRDALRLIPG